MKTNSNLSPSLSKVAYDKGDLPPSLPWAQALQYFQSRQAVIFISYCRFWEKHAFVQQCLAKVLVEHGVRVFWLDGEGWRPHRPTFYWNSPLLKVEQLPALPGRRFTWCREVNTRFQSRRIQQVLAKYPRALIWVQAGTDEALADQLPYVDLYSTFDDPYRHLAEGALCQKAKVLFCQNSYAYDLLGKMYPAKTELMFPPVEYTLQAPLVRESGLRRRHTLGYLGSFFSYDYDLDLFERFVHQFPQWDFLLVGRTDRIGMRVIERLKQRTNFFHVPWVPKEALAKFWYKLDVSLLFYRAHRTQNGAFPVKVLESFGAGVPAIATCVPKTRDLDGFVPRSPVVEELIEYARHTLYPNAYHVQRSFEFFQRRMSPKFHLSVAAERLLRISTSVPSKVPSN